MSLIQMQPVTGPKAWRGDEMARDPSTPWPVGPHFPEHFGYALSGSKALLET
jgi:hypothetical protein